MRISSNQIVELRNLTGAGIMDCKRVLEEALGDIGKAKALLQDMACHTAQKKGERVTKAGIVEAYVHGEGRIGVLLELNCETDFLSRSREFRILARELALQVASEAPKYVCVDDVPPEAIREVEADAEAFARGLGKPERVVPGIIAGRVKKFLNGVCLMEQKSIKDPEVRISSMVNSLSSKAGENVRIGGFTRYEIG